MSKTNFSSICDVPLSVGHVLHLEGNSKITCNDGTYDEPAANSFSLPHISSCPGSTVTCRASCYVNGLKRYVPEHYERFVANQRTVNALLLDRDVSMRSSFELAAHIAQTCTRFRWHVSGDVFSFEYASWIHNVCVQAPKVQFWIYTRTFNRSCLEALTAAPNLVVNLSMDKDNALQALATYRVFRKRGVRLCAMATEEWSPSLGVLPAGSVIFPDYPLRGRDLDKPAESEWWKSLHTSQRRMVCPADAFGQSRHLRCGPCKKCLRPAV